MSMIFTLHRRHNDSVSTIGEVFAPGYEDAICWLLEPGTGGAHPRIAAGTYEITLRSDGEKFAKFAAVPDLRPVIAPTRLPDGEISFAPIAPGLPFLHVPGREWILLHPGNTIADTLGCGLPGEKFVTPEHSNSGHYEVVKSQIAFEKLYELIRHGLVDGYGKPHGQVFWQVVDEGGV